MATRIATNVRLFGASLLLPLALAAFGACEPPADDSDGMTGEADGGDTAVDVDQEIDLSGWNVEMDQDDADPSGFSLVVQDDGFRITTGPAGVAWRPADLVERGDYGVSATFRETGSPEGHREAYGLIVGGRNLGSPDRQYTYFLVRGDGSYLVKRRDGEETETLVDWSPSEEVSALEDEENENRLEIRVRGQDVEFVANGAVLETLSADEVAPWGFAGVRVNHRLDVEVTGWRVEGNAARQGGGTGESGGEAEDTTGV